MHLAFLIGCLHPDPKEPVAVPGAVAADHPLASEAGARMLRQGGNAVDAAIAAALSSGVVQPAGSGLGGGGFAIVVEPDGDVLALDFREVAPAAASRDMFASGASSREGGLAVAVPTQALGLVELHRRAGRLPLSAIAAPAIEQASTGFETGPHLAKSLLEAPGMSMLFEPGNRRTALAASLRALVDTQGEAFRTGWVAQDLVDATRAAGGVLEMSDLAAYTVKEREALRGSYGPWSVVTMPPPSSGGIALLQLLGAADATTSEHCRVEAAKHAMADRASWGADPDFVPVDVAAMLAPARIAAIRADCGPSTFPPEHYAPPVAPPEDGGTLHVSVLDAQGYAVALTTTINTAFGSRVVAPKSGILLNNEMDDFATRPGEPNAFGLVQAEANAPGPGRRPLSSMTPTVVLDAAGRPVLAVGASGGPTIITASYQVLASILDDGADPLTAVGAPRWHHQWLPDLVFVEPELPTRPDLEAAGHVSKEARAFSAVQAVVRRDGAFYGGSDPRRHGKAVVVP